MAVCLLVFIFSFSFCACPSLHINHCLLSSLPTDVAPPQPQELTDVLEISNMVFTSLFSLEMLLKLLALGLFGYLKNPYNGFDSIIVIIRSDSGGARGGGGSGKCTEVFVVMLFVSKM